MSAASNKSGKPADIPEAVGLEPEGKKSPWTDAYFRSLVRGAIRRIYFLWPMRKAVLDRVRVELPTTTKAGKPGRMGIWHRCESCGTLGKAQLSPKNLEKVKTAKKAKTSRPEDVPLRIWVDHVEPVVSLDGVLPDWGTYINRTFVTADKMQALCDHCHTAKTQEENATRRQNVKERKQMGRRDGENHTTVPTDGSGPDQE